MPGTPKTSIAENIIAAIVRLSKRSAELRESAERNGLEARRLAERIAGLQEELDRITKP